MAFGICVYSDTELFMPGLSLLSLPDWEHLTMTQSFPPQRHQARPLLDLLVTLCSPFIPGASDTTLLSHAVGNTVAYVDFIFVHLHLALILLFIHSTLLLNI